MSAIAVQSSAPLPMAPPPAEPSQAVRPRNLGDRVFFYFLNTAAFLAPLLIVVFLAVLVYGAWPAISNVGLKALANSNWNPTHPRRPSFGMLAFIYGTVVTSILALLIAAPIGIGVAAFLNEVVGKHLRSVVGFLIEILATIPSVVYGIWGIFVLAPWVEKYLQPVLASRFFNWIPLFAAPTQESHGRTLLTAVLVLAIMVLPIIVSISLDAMRMVPVSYREAALGLGATRWEMIRIAVIPPARTPLIGACILALGRALGETMAVTMVIGNASSLKLNYSLLAAGNTITSIIANQYNNTNDAMEVSALMELALFLFIITLAVNIIARLIVRKTTVGGGLK